MTAAAAPGAGSGQVLMVDRAVGFGRLATAVAAATLASPNATWARGVVAVAVVVLSFGGLASLLTAAVATSGRVATAGGRAVRPPPATTVRIALGFDLAAGAGLAVAFGLGSPRGLTVGTLAFTLLPLTEAAVRYGVTGLATMWLTNVAIMAIVAGAAVVAGQRVSVLATLRPSALLALLALPVGLLAVGLADAIDRFEVASDASRTRGRLLGELTRLAHDLAVERAAGEGRSCGTAASTALLVRCLSRLGFDEVLVVAASQLGAVGRTLAPADVPRIFAADELASAGGPATPAPFVGRTAFVAVARLNGYADGSVAIGWAGADPLLAARLEAFAAAVAQTRAALAVANPSWAPDPVSVSRPSPMLVPD